MSYSTYTCPTHICAMFRHGEESKAAGRALAIEWLLSQPINPGDLVFMPHPRTGYLIEFKGTPGTYAKN